MASYCFFSCSYAAGIDVSSTTAEVDVSAASTISVKSECPAETFIVVAWFVACLACMEPSDCSEVPFWSLAGAWDKLDKNDRRAGGTGSSLASRVRLSRSKRGCCVLSVLKALGRNDMGLLRLPGTNRCKHSRD